MARPKVCILRTAGTNCDRETAFAFFRAGGDPDFVHINRLINGEKVLNEYAILALPGGFTYGDDIAAGKILANEIRSKLTEDLKNFVAAGKLIIGICNGFQILVKSGLLPGNADFAQTVSLIINDSGKFEDRWIYLKSSFVRRPSSVKCVWTRDLPEVIYLPVAHGEGKFVADKKLVSELKDSGQIVFQYCNATGRAAGYPHNPNGSMEDIAGITDKSGRILGLMPHPERHISALQHPRWTFKKKRESGDGLQIFKNAVNYVKKELK